MSNEILGDRGTALEELFFAREGEKFRQVQQENDAAENTKAALSAASGISNDREKGAGVDQIDQIEKWIPAEQYLQKSPKGFVERNLCCAVLSTGITAQQVLETRSIKSTPASFVEHRHRLLQISIASRHTEIPCLHPTVSSLEACPTPAP